MWDLEAMRIFLLINHVITNKVSRPQAGFFMSLAWTAPMRQASAAPALRFRQPLPFLTASPEPRSAPVIGSMETSDWVRTAICCSTFC